MLGVDGFPEREVLGSILSGAEIPNSINVGMFFSSRNKIIFTALKNLKQKCSPDLVILVNYLEETGLVDEAGGAAYVAELTNLVPGPNNIDYYCGKLQEAYQNRTAGTAIRIAAENIAKGGDTLAIVPELISKLNVYDRGTRKVSWTAAELLDAEFPEIRWVVPGLIPSGLSVLAGAPKLGKSWLALSLAIAAATGSFALGKIPVEKADVLYLALEDTGRRLQDRLRKLNATRFENLQFFTDWATGATGLAAYLGQYPDIRFVVVDTWAKFAKVRDQNDYIETTQRAAELKAIADELDIAILAIHHTRKNSKDSGGDWVDAVLGSQGLSGAADSTIILRRRRGTNQAELLATGRDIEEQELVLSFDANCGGWTLEGNRREVQESQARQDILDWLKENGPHTPTQIHKKMADDGVERSLSTIKTLLGKMAKDGSITNNNGIYSVVQSETDQFYKLAHDDLIRRGRTSEQADCEAQNLVDDYLKQQVANL